jgi:hypothetical protein
LTFRGEGVALLQGEPHGQRFVYASYYYRSFGHLSSNIRSFNLSNYPVQPAYKDDDVNNNIQQFCNMIAAASNRESVRIPPSASDEVVVEDVKMYDSCHAPPGTSHDKNYGKEMTSSCSIDTYEYGEAMPDSALRSAATNPGVPRRSSMKGSSSSSSSTRRQQQQQQLPTRRASIGAFNNTTIDVHLPGRKDPVIRRRSICFEENVSVQQVIPAASLAEDPKALWLQDSEYDFITTKIMTMVEHVRHSDAIVTIDPNGDISINGTCYDSRGLEHLLVPEISDLKRTRALDCVLHEQFLQRQVGDYDEDSLANIYKFTTVRSQREATHRAHQDAKVADQYLESTRTKFRHRRTSM